MFGKFDFQYDDALLRTDEIAKFACYIDKKVAETEQNLKPKIQKQNFKDLQNEAYEPVVSELSVSIGRDIADKKPVELRFNTISHIHAFILGQSGSGKSVLLNNIITSAILKYSPEDLMLYLMDFKGVEFNRYRDVKHTKAILVDNSDMQMTLEVLRELKEENKRRVKLWQREGVNNINGYNKKHLNERLPQILFIADECQVMFKPLSAFGASGQIQREISEILNVIATQGRSQGIHMLLATQQLDETDISGQVLKNLTECILLMSAPSDSERLVPDSSDMTSRQPTGLACYYHKKEFQSQLQTYYASDEELENAIEKAKEKSVNNRSNGAYFFCGSSMLYIDNDVDKLKQLACGPDPVAMLGHGIGLSDRPVSVTLRDDYSENILFFGVNKREQAIGGIMNALVSLAFSNQRAGVDHSILVFDCLSNANAQYKHVLSKLAELGLCRIVPRPHSGEVMQAIVEDLKNNCAHPVTLVIIGHDHFFEMKKDLPLSGDNSSSAVDGIEPLGFDMGLGGGSRPMTYQKALTTILEDGPLQGVHVLLQVDRPGNILFQGDYGDNAIDKFNYKVIFRSENKWLTPLRMSQDIDVENLGEDEERLRAYYCAEGETPMLFTPYQMPEDDALRLLFNK